MRDNCVDVLIVGAGPTGMLMAAEVARYGLTCRIIDKGITYQDESRAVAIQARTMEIFEHLGLAEAFLAEGLRVKVGNPICSFHKLGKISFNALESSYPFILSLEQVKTEGILERYLTTFGLKIEKGVEFLRMKQREEDVEVVVAHTASGQEETIQATWVVGCDGAHSQVRKQLNLAFEGKPLLGVFSIADVHIHWDYPVGELFVFLDKGGILAAIPLPEPKRYRLIFQMERCLNLLKECHFLSSGQLKEEIVAKPQLAEVQALLWKHTGSYVLVSELFWCANFCINSRMAETYQKGSVFLAGDAAHIHSPIGGQGMNTGLQDAFNLAWKLALVHNKQAGKKLLDTYDLERRSVGKKLLQATEIASQIAALQNRVAIALRNAAIFCFTRISFFQRSLVRIISQTSICYPRSRIVGPQSGFRAPDAYLLHQDEPTSLYALWRKSTSFYLLLFTGKEAPNFTFILQKVAAHPIIPIVIFEGNPPLVSHTVQSFKDSSGSAHRLYGAKGCRAVLIRPDLYIGYQTDNLNELNLDSYFFHEV